MSTKENSQNKELIWHWAGNVIIVGIIICNGYTIFAPLWPALQLRLARSTPLPATLVISEGGGQAIDRSRNHLIIPDLRVDAPVGTTVAALNDGAWLRPAGSNPTKGGNTVLAGHRFAYGASTLFYNLDKLHTGAEVGLVYEGKLYRYIVERSFIAQPAQTEIEHPDSPTPKLTLYTCTPLFTAKERLVVEAMLREVL